MKLSLVNLLSIVLLWSCMPSEKTEIDPDFMREIEASFKEFDNRTIYTNLDPKILSAIPDDQLEQAIIDFIFTKLEDNWENESAVVRSLSPALSVFYATWILEAEVNNGGYNQFFYNSSGQWITEAIEGFRLFGASAHAENAEHAFVIYKEEKERLDAYRESGTLEAFSDSYNDTQLGKVDDDFFSITENLSQLRIAYIRRNPDQFSGF